MDSKLIAHLPDANLSNPVPDMEELVNIGGSYGKVAGWWKLRQIARPPFDTSTEMGLVNQIVYFMDIEDPKFSHYRLIRCKREEATVVDLGTFRARLDDPSIHREGKYAMPLEFCQSQAESFLRRVGNLCFPNYGNDNGYLEWMFPELDILEYGYNKE